jgi:hypothetical protein
MSRISVSRVTSGDGSGGSDGLAASFLFRVLIALITIKIAKAIIVKSMMDCMNLP